MAPVTQILLIISYAILGVAVATLPPRLFGLDQDIASFLGLLVFFGAWQLQSVLIHGTAIAEAKRKLAYLEDVTLILRKDIERTRREVDARGREGDKKNDLVVSELKVLQTLLSQVNRKELEIKGLPVPEDMTVSEEEAMTLSVRADDVEELLDEENIETDTTHEDTTTDGIITASDIEALELAPEEAALVMQEVEASKDADGAQRGQDTARAGRVGSLKKAPIRIIKKEDQLLSVVRDSLSENRVDLYMQPMVSLPSRRVVHYECFSRVRDDEGRIILPRQYLKVAETKGLIGTIDNLLLFRLIQLVRRIGKRKPDVRFFCNMSRYSIMDNEFFPQFIDFMTSNSEFASRLVFEIAQEDYNQLDESVKDSLLTLGRRGFAFSMDLVSDFTQQDFAALEGQYFKFIKSDLRDLLAAHPEPGDVAEFKSFLRRKGMNLIVTRIENEEKVLQALDAQVEFAQGYLFGEPVSSVEVNREL